MERQTHLLRSQVHRDPMQSPQDLIDERLMLARLLHDEMSSALLRNLDKRITRHVLDTCVFMSALRQEPSMRLSVRRAS